MIDYAGALNDAQYAAATNDGGPVLVVAGAGSGKTRTIVYRLAWLAEHGVPPEAILLLTFTRKAAHEMLHRAGLLLNHGLAGVQGGTFHAFGFATLRRWKPPWLGERPFTVMDQADVNEAIRHCKEELGLGRGDRSFPKPQGIAALLSKARNKELPLDEVLQREAFHLLPHAQGLAQLGELYAAYRRDKGLLDYDDLLFELEALLRQDATAAACLRERFRHILVDEYQDTNKVQARIVRLLAGPENEAPGNVMAVGDEAQSIYAFRGADVRNILDFPKLFPGAHIIRLEENYRSTQPVLDLANNLLAHAAESFGKRLFTRRHGGAPVRLVTPLSDRSEASLVLRRIRELLATHPPREIAVLFRAGYHSIPLEMALEQARIPFRKVGGLRYTETAHAKDFFAYARLLLNPLDQPAFARMAALHSGIGPKTAERLYAAARNGDPDALRRAFARFAAFSDDLRFLEGLRLRRPPLADTLDALLERYQPQLEAHYPEDWPRRRQELESVLQSAADYDELDVFVADKAALDGAVDDAADDDGEKITLSTVHSAKGLEWDAVCLIELVENRFPSYHAQARPEVFEEERRLMYVACTRARELLELYVPASVYDRAERDVQYVSPSPFVRELPPGLAEEWLESYGGHLSRRTAGGVGLGRRTRAGDLPTAAAGQPAYEDCQLPPGEQVAAPGTAAVAGAGHEGCAPARPEQGELCHCRHRIFGRGKIIRHVPPDKVQVNFPGFGLKIILREYLLLEN